MTGQLIKETMDEKLFSYRPLSFFYPSLTVPLLLKANQLGFETKQCTMLNEIKISIKIHVIQDFSRKQIKEI